MNENSKHKIKCNRIYCWIKAIAYNIINWFRESILPESMQKCEISTIRRTILNVCANSKGSGRFIKIQFQSNKWLEIMNSKIKTNLIEFINGLPPTYILKYI